MIPAFPKFKKLEIIDKKEVEKTTLQFPPSSDFNFLGLWSYNIADDIAISKLHGNLVIQSRDYLTSAPFFSFLGVNKFNQTAMRLIKYAQGRGIDSRLRLIPECNIKNLSDASIELVIEEDRDNYDYVYAVNELHTLAGSKFGKKRNLLNKFNKKYETAVAIQLDATKKTEQKKLLDVFTIWERNKKISPTEAEHERIAIQRLFDASNLFYILIVALEHQNVLIGFSIIEIIGDKHAMCHFSKANIQFDGVYEKLYHEIGKSLDARGVSYLNREQDLGIPGLRMAKSDWNPASYIKKYCVSLKS